MMTAAAAAVILSSNDNISGEAAGHLSGASVMAAERTADVVDSEYQFSDNEQQNFAIKTITCVVAVLGAICVFTLLYIGIRLLSNDSMGSSPSSKLNRSDDSGHIMIGGGSPASAEGKLLTIIEPKYYIAASTPTGPHVGHGAYQPLSSLQKGDGSHKLSALEYHLLAPQLVSKLEKGNSDGEECTSSERLMKPMISSNSSGCGDSSSSNSNCRRSSKNSNNNNNRMPINSSAVDCNCNLAKNCRNCSSTNVKFTNELWLNKDNRRK